jgi:8-oxo-dGTP pyrophosphatase MutT (NUDIX family)
MKMLSVRLDDREAAALRELCEETGLTRSQVIKRGLAVLARDKVPRPGELARQFGVYGCFAGPRNLSERSGRALGKVLRATSAR